MFEKIYYFFSSVKYGIENLIRWFPVIWNDRNWDQYYLYVILRKKLSTMEKYHKNYGHCVDSDRTAKEIRICKVLLSRLIEDNYVESLFKKHDKKWGELKLNFECNEEQSNTRELIFFRTNIKNEDDKKKETKEFLRLCNHEDYLKKQDIEYFTKVFRKHVRSWWD